MSGLNYLTQAGFDQLRSELDHLKTTGRQEAAKAIAEAREKGDLSENAEYHAAKDAQGMLEMKINELEKKLMNVRIIDESTIDTSQVVLLASVKLLNHKTKKEIVYKIVSEAEADIKSGKISASSPLGQGLLGKKVGERAEIKTPAGNLLFEVLDIGH